MHTYTLIHMSAHTHEHSHIHKPTNKYQVEVAFSLQMRRETAVFPEEGWVPMGLLGSVDTTPSSRFFLSIDLFWGLR